jgi:hypothetical protein
MKKTFAIVGFIILTGISCQSCKQPCQCEPVTIPDFECKILNQQGQNLIFGSQALYKVDSLKVLKTRNDFSVHNASVRRSFSDSSNLRFDFYVPEAKSFFYYNQQAKTDSLEINWVERKGKCCGEPYTYYSVAQVKFNGTVIQPQNQVYYFIKQ